MSIISTRHNVNLFVSGESKPLTGQRLAKVGYKTTAKTPAKFPSICVSIPPIPDQDITDNLSRLIPNIREFLSGAQDGIIRSLYESREGSLNSISDDEISVSACINFLDAESTGSRWTKDYLVDWFNTNIRDNLIVVIADRLGLELATPEEEARVNVHINAYRELISSLSGGKTVLEKEQIHGIRRALDVSSIDDETSGKLLKRLDQLENKPKAATLLAL